MLKIVDAHKTYRKGKVKALDGLTLEVVRGSILGIVGANGAGKSTLINAVAGLVRLDNGSIEISGREISSNPLYKRETGFVLEQPVYLEKLSAREYLEFTGGMFGLTKENVQRKVDELLAFFDLEDNQSELIESYSKGMKRKVSLAAAIIHEPELLILDEPFEGVDIQTTDSIVQILKRMQQLECAILLSSHLLELVESLCTHCAVIDKGKIVLQGRMDGLEELLKSLGRERTMSLREIFLKITSDPNSAKHLSWL